MSECERTNKSIAINYVGSTLLQTAPHARICTYHFGERESRIRIHQNDYYFVCVLTVVRFSFHLFDSIIIAFWSLNSIDMRTTQKVPRMSMDSLCVRHFWVLETSTERETETKKNQIFFFNFKMETEAILKTKE